MKIYNPKPTRLMLPTDTEIDPFIGSPREAEDERQANRDLEESRAELHRLVYTLAQRGIRLEGLLEAGGKSIVYRLTRRPFLRKPYAIDLAVDLHQLDRMR